MPLEFFEGPMDGQRLDGMPDGEAYHQGEGVYTVKDQDGNVIAEARFHEEPLPAPPPVLQAIKDHHRRELVVRSLSVISTAIYLGGLLVVNDHWGRNITSVAWLIVMVAVLIRR